MSPKIPSFLYPSEKTASLFDRRPSFFFLLQKVRRQHMATQKGQKEGHRCPPARGTREGRESGRAPSSHG